MKLTFPLDVSIPSLSNIVDDVFTRKSISQEQIISNKYIQCLFYDETKRELSEEGCLVDHFTPLVIVCACNHLTDFVVFAKGSYEPLLNSNYHAFTALNGATSPSLKTNRGVWLSCVLVGSMALFLICSELTSYKSTTKERYALISL